MLPQSPWHTFAKALDKPVPLSISHSLSLSLSFSLCFGKHFERESAPLEPPPLHARSRPYGLTPYYLSSLFLSLSPTHTHTRTYIPSSWIDSLSLSLTLQFIGAPTLTKHTTQTQTCVYGVVCMCMVCMLKLSHLLPTYLPTSSL